MPKANRFRKLLLTFFLCEQWREINSVYPMDLNDEDDEEEEEGHDDDADDEEEDEDEDEADE